MTLRKRGLGRGLEALLVDVADKEEKYPPQTSQAGEYRAVKDRHQDEIKAAPVLVDNDMTVVTPPFLAAKSAAQAGEVDGRTAMVVELFKNIQREHLVLLDEAESLRKLIEEFESIVRADLT
ncbi:MAG: hypothetical protein EPN17_15640 [Methylobacter sp.]|nr:MAG: hypothetical protein EPN17_15640 [Methylobacter sp.]